MHKMILTAKILPEFLPALQKAVEERSLPAFQVFANMLDPVGKENFEEFLESPGFTKLLFSDNEVKDKPLTIHCGSNGFLSSIGINFYGNEFVIESLWQDKYHSTVGNYFFVKALASFTECYAIVIQHDSSEPFFQFYRLPGVEFSGVTANSIRILKEGWAELVATS